MKAIEEMEQKLESRSDGDGESSVVVISIPRSQEVEETKKESTWQMIAKYKSAVFWSSFVGLAGINWGMDVLVRTPFPSSTPQATDNTTNSFLME